MRAAKTNAIPTRASLIGRLKNWDDQKSWDEFNRTYRQFIVGFAVKQGLREPEAEDVAQETLLAVARSIGGFNYDSARSSFKNWLLTVARHRITDYVRRRPNEVELQPGTPEDSTRTSTEARSADPDRPALELIEAGESERAMMEEALERLKTEVSTEHFRIFYLSTIKEQPPAKVAKALGVSSRWARSIWSGIAWRRSQSPTSGRE
jgi:RNA polymerase sigma factor (sigma-70 family)